VQAYNHILDGRRLLLKRNTKGKGSVKVLFEGVDHCVQILMSTQGEVTRGDGFTFFPLFIADFIIKGFRESSLS